MRSNSRARSLSFHSSRYLSSTLPWDQSDAHKYMRREREKGGRKEDREREAYVVAVLAAEGIEVDGGELMVQGRENQLQEHVEKRNSAQKNYTKSSHQLSRIQRNFTTGRPIQRTTHIDSRAVAVHTHADIHYTQKLVSYVIVVILEDDDEHAVVYLRRHAERRADPPQDLLLARDLLRPRAALDLVEGRLQRQHRAVQHLLVQHWQLCCVSSYSDV